MAKIRNLYFPKIALIFTNGDGKPHYSIGFALKALPKTASSKIPRNFRRPSMGVEFCIL